VKLEQKKIVLEWLGWVLDGYFKDQNGKGRALDLWNPDTNHNDFKEVWDKLTDDNKSQLMWKLSKTNTVEHFPSAISLILNDLPQVMEAVMEVIKEK